MQCKGCANKIPQSILDSVFQENTKKFNTLGILSVLAGWWKNKL